MLSLEDAIQVIEAVIRRSLDTQQPIDHTLVVVGGTALAAHGVRAQSADVDLYARTLSADVIAEVEAEERARRGPAFKLDATTTENLWGSILVRDIEQDARTLVREVAVGAECFIIRALSVETLFLLKVAAGRARDRDDLALLAPKSTPDALIARFNVLVQWHGDHHALPAFADTFVASLRQLYGVGPEIIDRLELPKLVRRMLWETHRPSL